MKVSGRNLPEITIGHIKYMNVAPVNYSFDSDRLSKNAVWHNITASPAELNRRMKAGELDISSVSAAAYAFNSDDWVVIPGLSIGCRKEVMSVILASDYPVEELDGKKVAFTMESDSAASLMKIIFFEKGVSPEIEIKSLKKLEDAGPEYSAALIIGDAALTVDWWKKFRYVYDLCSVWNEIRGLPFVFGLWAARRESVLQYPELIEEVAVMLRASLAEGLVNLDRISADSAAQSGLSYEKCKRYFSLLDYRLPEAQIAGLKKFYDDLYSIGLIKKAINIEFL